MQISRILLLWLSSLIASYLFVVALFVHVCDRRIDKLASDPLASYFLTGIDIPIAMLYGTAFAVIVILIRSIVAKFAASWRVGALLSPWSPFIAVAIAIVAIFLVVNPISGQCRL